MAGGCGGSGLAINGLESRSVVGAKDIRETTSNQVVPRPVLATASAERSRQASKS